MSEEENKNKKKRKKSPEGRMRGQKENKKRECEGWGVIEEESEVLLVRNKKEKRKEV